MVSKKALSGVVEVVLIMLITIAAFGLMVSFIIPMIKKNLDKSELCFNAGGQISLSQEQYTCTSAGYTLIKVDRKTGDEIGIKSLIFSISSDGSSERFEVINGTPVNSDVKMYNGTKTILIIPNPGEAQTYNFTRGNIDSVKIALLLQGDIICGEEISEQIVNRC